MNNSPPHSQLIYFSFIFLELAVKDQNNIINPDNDILKRAADIVSTTNKDELASTIWSELL
jgi:hypothetical protein